jgi:RNA recognition motif-containing protein
MGKKLYVGNLPFSVTDQDLNSIFGEIGAVTSARVITDRDTGRSKGFGFVEMTNDEDAAKAISKFDGGELEGRQIRVNEARPMESRPMGAGGSDRGAGRSNNRW